MNNNGFTIIEVLVSLIILSMIALVSSNILKSSLQTEQETSLHLNSIKELNLASSIIRRDIRQIANVSSKDFYGNDMYGTFISPINSDSLMFNSHIKSLSDEISPIKRIQYEFEDNKLIRKQFFSSNPYEPDDYTITELINDIDNLEFTFLHENSWHESWPISLITSKKIPTLIKIEFSKQNKNYSWIIDPNITYAIQD
ncbi:MAG: prepilin-type N-terminal cleavage/methylation domain-containing protein [Proteobacteria bacterium]|nr:prepilin-type N-terminal cleavage/methylation domain-containing protein [Pseudomonadota bacterium]MDA0976206.1 prepilin-type N-terminal cleavage/methylation domain-containing protein [Pseudomonadota bacterium]MDA1036852.1 prepilin-type N-terminal cleavage/methylation domain-containing protein [Pseudomonadota bacterium]